METKPEALVSEGCVPAHLVLKTVSVVTEQTRSDKGGACTRSPEGFSVVSLCGCRLEKSCLTAD